MLNSSHKIERMRRTTARTRLFAAANSQCKRAYSLQVYS
jgi:hypothetical protein